MRKQSTIQKIHGRTIAFVLAAAALACSLPGSVPAEPGETTKLPGAGATVSPAAPAPTDTPAPTPVPPTLAPTLYIPTATPTLAPLGEVLPIPESGYEYLGDINDMAIGFNMDGGGSVGSFYYRGIELVDDTDFGRYIQISPYDGDDVYIGGGPEEYGEFGWNPLQSGGRGAGGNAYAGTVLEFRRGEGVMYVKTLAKEWGPAEDVDSDTVYEVWAFQHDGYFEVLVRATHIGDVYHTTGIVEFPAAYFEFDLTRAFTYQGAQPFTGADMQALDHVAGPFDLPGSPACPGIIPTEGWAAYARDDGIGLVLAMPPQPYLSRDWALCLLYDGPPVAYISPLAFFDFGPGDTREMRYYLIPGDIAEARKIVYDLLPHMPWEFNLDTLEGWTTPGAVEAAGGVVRVTLATEAPFTSGPGLAIPGRVTPALVLRGRAVDADVGVCLEYLSIHQPDWIADDGACVVLAPGEMGDYVFDLREVAAWRASLVTQLRLRPTAPGVVEIDSIDVVSDGLVWDFFGVGENVSFDPVNQLEDLVVAGGFMRMRSVGNDPYFHLPLLRPLEAGDHPVIEIRMKVEAGEIGQVFFQPVGGVFSEANSLVFEIVADGEFHTYTLDMSAVPGWDGRISSLRLDPTDTVGVVEVDYVLVP